MSRLVHVLLATTVIGAARTPPMTQAEMERFLKTARILQTKELVPGSPSAKRATLDDGKMKHDAQIQTVNVTRGEFEGPPQRGINVREWYGEQAVLYDRKEDQR